MQRNKKKKKQKEVVWGQCWLPVCLWNTSQLALTVNAGKPSSQCWAVKVAAGGSGVEAGRWVKAVEEGEFAVKMACMWMASLMMGLGGGRQPFTKSLGPE